MTPRIEKARGIGFCFGVRRALNILETAAREHGTVETLGAIVHNQPVLDRLASIGVRIASEVDDIRGSVVAISAHGVSPQVEQEIKSRHIDIMDTTCPFVHRAQIAARRLARAGFSTIVYGDAHHPEVKGVLGWAGNKGLATVDEQLITELKPLPRRLGVISQTTQVPEYFNEFAKKLVDDINYNYNWKAFRISEFHQFVMKFAIFCTAQDCSIRSEFVKELRLYNACY